MKVEPLSSSHYRSHVDTLVQAALAAANPAKAVSKQMQRNGRLLTIAGQKYDTSRGNIILISVGKASVQMAQAAIELIGDVLHAGIIITKAGQLAHDLPYYEAITLFHAAHPVSDESSEAATTAVTNLLHQTTPDDLVLFLISGGTSALLTQPRISLKSWQQLNNALLASGCPITAFNCVRRQLDQVKGGGLAAAAAPATCVALILSDVVGSPLADIGSGPTAKVTETAVEALAVLTQYNIETQVETAVWQQITTALASSEKAAQAASCQNIIIGDVRTAAEAAQTAANTLGFTTHLLTAHLEGEARTVGQIVTALAKDAPPNACLILGGETTVTLRGNGIGGRNLETALSAAVALDGWPRIAITSFATDGDDGPTQAAGATVTGETAGNGRLYSLDPHAYLENNDSYTFFSQLAKHTNKSCLIQTGFTGTNVNDLIFIMTYET
jgi:glycerate 2-kinase